MSIAAQEREAFAKISRLRANIEKVFVGQERVLQHLLTGLLAGGHVLIEDVPGVGKTTLARALARSLEGAFRRIQFTPDLLPSDILGISLYDQDKKEFVFKPGPVFANVVLADEINRTPPRTQSALLEAMNERQVSVDGEPRDLPAPFIVLATMNPAECHGTYDLPESQLDRFLLRLEIGYPDREGTRRILRQEAGEEPLEHLEAVLLRGEILAVQELVRETTVAPSVEDYLLILCEATRTHPEILLGASPRATLALFQAAQARAFLDSRNYVAPDDVKELAGPVLAHRLLVRSPGKNRALEVIREILARLPVP